MLIQGFLAVGAGAVVVLAAAAQVGPPAPTCCKYLWEWPEELNPPKPGGPCSGSFSTACQTGVDIAGSQDPNAKKYDPTLQPAICRWVLFGQSNYFIRQDCNLPAPPHTTLIAVLPNGQCCYVGGIGIPEIDDYPAGYMIPTCEDECASSPSEN